MRRRVQSLLGLTQATSAPVTPLPVTGAFAWYDADALSTLYQDTGASSPVTSDAQTVALWQDRTGNGNHLTQGTAGVRPIYKTGQQNSKAGIHFDGTRYIDSAVNFPTVPSTIIFAAKRTATVGVTQGLFSARDSVGGGSRMGFNSSDFLSTSVASPSTTKLSTASFSANAPIIGGAVLTGSLMYVIANAEYASVSCTYTGVTQLYGLGRFNVNNTSSLANCYILEFVIFARELTTQEVSDMVSYLNTKWVVY